MIKMKSLLNENAGSVQRIALDMDGVLCDFGKQYRKYLENDRLWNSVITYKKAISNGKLEKLGISREEFIKSATELRNRILASNEVDVYGMLSNSFKQKFTMSPAWALLLRGGESYWSDMDWQPGGQELVKYLKTLNIPIEILTAGSGPAAKAGKQMWLKSHGLNDLKFNIVGSGKDKWEFAESGDLLIDDMKENVRLFVDAGGMGILHTSTPDTIQQLNKLGL